MSRCGYECMVVNTCVYWSVNDCCIRIHTCIRMYGYVSVYMCILEYNDCVDFCSYGV